MSRATPTKVAGKYPGMPENIRAGFRIFAVPKNNPPAQKIFLGQYFRVSG